MLAVVAGTAAAAVVVLTAADSSPGTGPGGMRQVSLTARPARTVALQGVPGQLTVVGAAAGQVRLTGSLHWSGRPGHPDPADPAVTAAWLDHGHLLRLSSRCAAASRCTENYRLAVPRRTAVVVRQPAGHVIISGLGGPLRITASSVDVSAVGLRCPSLAATITSGHLAASFDAAPRQVSVTLTAAQATLRLPAAAGYAVSSQVTSGYLRVGVPQASGAARTVSARIVSGELELLPRWAPPPGQRRGLAARKPMLAAQIAVAVLSLG